MVLTIHEKLGVAIAKIDQQQANLATVLEAMVANHTAAAASIEAVRRLVSDTQAAVLITQNEVLAVKDSVGVPADE